MSITLVWFRQDLRLADHQALSAAVARGGAVVPVFIWSPDEEAPWQPGGATRWWLHHSLTHLADRLKALGAKLVIRHGPAGEVLRSLVRETGADRIVWQRRYEPAVVERDKALKEALRHEGLAVDSYPGALLFEPWEAKTAEGKPYQVFSPFWRACGRLVPPAAPLPAPKRLPSPSSWPAGLELKELKLLPRLSWADGFSARWQPGEAGASKKLKRFLREAVGDYIEGRNRPAEPGTSLLSPHLHFGEISPRQVWHETQLWVQGQQGKDGKKQAEWFLREVGWREFAHHLLFHFPKTTEQPLRPEFNRFPWRTCAADLEAWQRGRTGYPIVDAGMRELWTTGWMHNRVRMIVASFLVKHLRLPWQEGARWFWDTLVDADLANNTLGWQWTAGCGADAAPYFRVFNPILQGLKFDPGGEYVRRWVPELGHLDVKWLFKPWEAPDADLERAGIRLGQTYPRPLVDHAEARAAALQAFDQLKR